MLATLYYGASKLAGIVDTVAGSEDATNASAPGAKKLQGLIADIRTWSLIAVVIAVIIAAVLWAWGSQSQNAAQATQGKKGILVAIAAGAVIVAANALIQWGVDFGAGV